MQLANNSKKWDKQNSKYYINLSPSKITPEALFIKGHFLNSNPLLLNLFKPSEHMIRYYLFVFFSIVMCLCF